MAITSDSCVILLTYKGKILLKLHSTDLSVLRRSSVQDVDTWTFFHAKRKNNKSFEKSIMERIKTETGIVLSNIQFLGENKAQNGTTSFFKANLSDSHVNNMIRGDGQVLQFFSPNELDLLNLTDMTKQFLLSNKAALVA